MKLLTKNTLIIILAVATIGSFIFSFWQGYLQLQIQYFIVITVVIAGFFYFLYWKSTKEVDYKYALKKSQEVLAGKTSEIPSSKSFVKIKRKTFLGSNNIWLVLSKGSPTKYGVVIDAPSGKVIGGDVDMQEGESPIKTLLNQIKPPEMTIKPLRHKKKIKYEAQLQ